MSESDRGPDAEPIWFGPSERPLLGWLDRPPCGEARGGVVICPPVGIELAHSHYVLRCLARELSAAGFAVLRFDYDGTGQSAGEMNDPCRLDAWRRSIDEAFTVLRESGVQWLAGIGLRLGATLLADVAAADDTLDAIALWDPYPNGKSFLREQTALHLVACPPAAPDPESDPTSHVEILGYKVGRPLAAELREFELNVSEALAGRRVMILADPARGGNARLAQRLPDTVAEWHEYAAVEGVFDTGELNFEAPRHLLSQLVAWITNVCDVAPVPLHPVSVGSREAVVGHAPDGTAIVETGLTLGEHRLAGIACAPATGAEGPTVLFLSVAAESSIGPVRQWVELSRRWAAAGVRSVRFDLSGLGESPIRSDLRERTVYAHEHVEEILAVAAAVSPEDPSDVVLVGVCSGAFQALVAGPRLRPRGIVAVNPILTFTMHDRPGDAPTSGPRAMPLVAGVAPPPAGGLRRWRQSLGARTPSGAWTVALALGLAASPAARLRPLARAGVNTLLMLGSHEAEVPLRRTPSMLTRLDATGASRVALLRNLDHSLRNQVSRELLAEEATSFLATLCGRSLSPAEPSGRAEPRVEELASAVRLA